MTTLFHRFTTSSSHLLLALFMTSSVTAQFGTANLIDVSSSEHWDLITVDIDGDTDLDLMYRVPGTGICWSENLDGLGAFGPRMIIDVESSFQQNLKFVLSDLDGDLDLDLVIHRPENFELIWRRNDGTGVFAPDELIASIPGNTYSTGLLCADIAGSALPEILFRDAGMVRWWVNDGGTFSTMDSLDHGVHNYSFFFSVGDIDMDGDLDHMIAGSEAVRVGLNNGTSWSSTTWNFPEMVGYAHGQELIDMDADGDLDFVDGGFGVYWIENMMVDSGILGSTTHTIADFAPNEGAAWATDLGCGSGASVLWCHWAYTQPIRWSHYRDDLGSFSAPAIISGLSSAGDGRLFFGDLNGDGRKDIIISRNDSLRWYSNELPLEGGSLANVPQLGTLCTWDFSGYALPDGTPSGGLWTGPFVGGSSNFNPASHGNGDAGTFVLHYGLEDNTGCIASATASIEVIDCTVGVDQLEINQAGLWPNPASDHAVFTFRTNAPQNVIITDAMGKVVWQKNDVTSPVDLPTTKLSSGLYNVRAGDQRARLVVAR